MIERPFGNRVIVVRDKKKENTTKSGIILTIREPESTNTGVVISSRIPGLTQGDRILFQKWSGYKYDDGTQEYLILDEADILAVLDSEAEVIH